MTRKDLTGKPTSVLDIDRTSLISNMDRECFDSLEVEDTGFRTILLLRYPENRLLNSF